MDKETDPAIGTNHDYDDSIWNYATDFEKEMNNFSSEKTNIDDTVSMGSKSYVNVETASKPKPKLNFRPLFNVGSVESSCNTPKFINAAEYHFGVLLHNTQR
ncbi:hypothetical protein Tco_0848004 [Tanacetum coccineum]